MDFQAWLEQRDADLSQALRDCDSIKGGPDAREAARAPIERERERVATALNLLDEFNAAR